MKNSSLFIFPTVMVTVILTGLIGCQTKEKSNSQSETDAVPILDSLVREGFCAWERDSGIPFRPYATHDYAKKCKWARECDDGRPQTNEICFKGSKDDFKKRYGVTIP